MSNLWYYAVLALLTYSTTICSKTTLKTTLAPQPPTISTRDADVTVDTALIMNECNDTFRTEMFETMGPWGPEARCFYKEISWRLVDISGDPKAGSYLAQRISLAIQRGNVASLLGTLPRDSAYIDSLNRSGSFPDETEKTPKCFVRCMLERNNVVSEDGVFDQEQALIFFTMQRPGSAVDDFRQSTDACINRNETCICERSYRFVKCVVEMEQNKNDM